MTIRSATRRRRRDDLAAREFVERFALILTSAGMQRMAARVFSALLTVPSGTMTARELAEFLQVSPAAVSGAIRYLETGRMARRGRRPGERTDHYTVGGDRWPEALLGRTDLITQLADAMADGADVFADDPAVAERMAEAQDFFGYLQQEMPRVVARWRDSRDQRK
ncbi:MAG TPA: MarR family transcriptional regulator [Jatrophihabitans sp.]|nr:MarR family transcriptional regulator [Jatrophihabitans sp.]